MNFKNVAKLNFTNIDVFKQDNGEWTIEWDIGIVDRYSPSDGQGFNSCTNPQEEESPFWNLLGVCPSNIEPNEDCNNCDSILINTFPDYRIAAFQLNWNLGILKYDYEEYGYAGSGVNVDSSFVTVNPIVDEAWGYGGYIVANYAPSSSLEFPSSSIKSILMSEIYPS